MNRRDIIIITVLINTGLLSALAMMAINTDDQGFIDQTELTKLATRANDSASDHEPLVIAQNTTIAADEWDTVLKDYVSSNSQQMASTLEDTAEEFEPPAAEIKKTVKEAPKKVVLAPPQAAPLAPQQVVSSQPVQQKPSKKTVEITVKKGDVLEKIARANGTSVEEIRALNRLKNDRLTIGQTLRVPAEPEKKTSPQSKHDVRQEAPKEMAHVKKAAVDEVEYYVIKSGDNPWKIAKQFHVKFDDLLRLNHLDEEKARNLKIGDRIRVK